LDSLILIAGVGELGFGSYLAHEGCEGSRSCHTALAMLDLAILAVSACAYRRTLADDYRTHADDQYLTTCGDVRRSEDG